MKLKVPFTKYQSLGNDFILVKVEDLFDSFDPALLVSESFVLLVQKWCHRHFGIGADGLLLFIDHPLHPEVIIINADGSLGQFSGNGSRCAAHFYAMLHNRTTSFQLCMGGRKLQCLVDLQTDKVFMEVPGGSYEGTATIKLNQRNFFGDLVHVGNPHLLLEATVENSTVEEQRALIKKDLSNVGYPLMTYYGNDAQKNIQMYCHLIDRPLRYLLVSYERGVGMTLACSSGAAALAWMLYSKAMLLQGQEIIIDMEGGIVQVTITSEQKISLRAKCTLLFYGVCEI